MCARARACVCVCVCVSYIYHLLLYCSLDSTCIVHIVHTVLTQSNIMECGEVVWRSMSGLVIHTRLGQRIHFAQSFADCLFSSLVLVLLPAFVNIEKVNYYKYYNYGTVG